MIGTTVMCSTHEDMISGGCQKTSSWQKIFYNLWTIRILQFIDFLAILDRILCQSLPGKRLISLQKSKLDFKIIWN